MAEDRELLDLYLAGTPFDKLLREISCGDVGIQGVKVIVPGDRYLALIARLDSLEPEQRSLLLRFLAYRCDRPFLDAYIAKHPEFIESLHVYSYLDAVPDVGVIVRLNELGLLPEEDRREVVTIIGDLALSTPDAYFLDEQYRSLLRENELQDILEKVREKLMPALEDTVSDWNWNFRGTDESPEAHFEPLQSTLQKCRSAFSSEQLQVRRIDRALEDIREKLAELENEASPRPRYGDQHEKFGPQKAETSRSVFDDVDD